MSPTTPTDHADADAAVPEAPSRRGLRPRDRVVAHALAADIARLHGEALLRTARRYSACADDAHDAYQRAMELLLAHAATIDRAKAVSWMHVVVRREASMLRRQAGRTVSLDDGEVDDALHRMATVPEEQLHAIDLAHSAGEALATLKENEAQALCLRAQGMSYDEIADVYGWSYTKTNRAITEGRKAFVDHYRAVESGVVCGDTAELITRYVAGTLKPRVAIKVRAHLVRCSGCRALLHAERTADTALHALLPPAFVAVAAHRGIGTGWLHDHLLGPIGHAAGRLQPAADHLLGSKLGVAAASTIALAGGGLAVEQRVARDPGPPPAIRSSATGTASATRPSTTANAAATKVQSPLVRVVDQAVDEGRAVEARVRQRAVTAERKKRAATRKRAAARARTKARRIANAREFAPGASEFDATTKASAARTAQATTAASAGGGGSGGAGSTGSGSASSAPAAAPEVAVGGTENDSSVDVVTEGGGSPGGSGSSVSDEFGD